MLCYSGDNYSYCCYVVVGITTHTSTNPVPNVHKHKGYANLPLDECPWFWGEITKYVFGFR